MIKTAVLLQIFS